MGRLTALKRSLSSAARGAIDRIRERLPGVLGRDSASTAVESAVEDVEVPARTPGDTGRGDSMTRQSTRSRSSATLENPARFADPDENSGDAGADRPPERSLPDAEPDGELPDPTTDRSGPEPVDDPETEVERRADGTVRIAAEDDPEAYVESDVSVALDHMR